MQMYMYKKCICRCICEYFSLHVSGHRGVPKTSYHFLILSHGSLRTTPFVLINLSLCCFCILNYQHLLKNHKIWATPHINGRLNCFWNGGLPLQDHHLRCIFCRKSSQKMSKYVHQSWIGRNMMQRIYLQNNIFQGSIQLWSLYLANIKTHLQALEEYFIDQIKRKRWNGAEQHKVRDRGTGGPR